MASNRLPLRKTTSRPPFQSVATAQKGDGKVFYLHVGDDFHDGLDDARAFDKVVDAEGEVSELQHLLPVDGLHPFTEFLEFPCCIDAADECSHGASCNRGDMVALRLNLLYGSDVCQASGSSA